MTQFSFEVKTDLATLSNIQLEANFDEAEKWLTEALEPYKSLAVTDETISEAKTVRANIRKVKDAINQKKIAVKNSILQSYTDTFEPRTKQLMALCDETINTLDNSVKLIEAEKKAAKMAQIEEHFNSLLTADIEQYLKFVDIVQDKWGNATVKVETAFTEVEKTIEMVKADLETIRNLDSEFETTLLDDYAKNHDLRNVLALDKALKERRRAEDERKANEIANSFKNAPVSVDEPTQPKIEPAIKPIDYEEVQKPKLYTLRFEVEVTKVQADVLKACFTDNGITYRKI